MESAISVTNLIIGYRHRSRETEIAKISKLDLAKGKLTCLLGANGIGKSTLIKTITGALPSLGGEVVISNHSLHDLSIIDRAKQLAIVLTDKPNLGYTTVYEMVALGRNPHTNWQNKLSSEDKLVINRSLEAIGMQDVAKQPLAELSDGNLQKVIIGRALAQETDIIILDEPTVHLDVSNKTTIIKLLRSLCMEHGKTVLLSTHDMDLAFKYADYLWLFDADTVIHGLSEDLIINGSINKVFPSVLEDRNTPNLNISITGPSELVDLTTSALLKAGVVSHSDLKEIVINQNGAKYELLARDKSYDSIASLINELS